MAEQETISEIEQETLEGQSIDDKISRIGEPKIAIVGDILEAEPPIEEIIEEQPTEPKKITVIHSDRLIEGLAKITSHGLEGDQKKKYQKDYSEIADAVCIMFNIDNVISTLLEKIKMRDIAPEHALLGFGVCMVLLAVTLRDDWQEKILEKIVKKEAK